MAKKKLTKVQKRERRKQKAVMWLADYTGSHVVRAYCKKFNVDQTCAIRELSELGRPIPDRQPEDTPGEPAFTAESSEWQYEESVSYTHLDVYKGQALRLASSGMVKYFSNSARSTSP